MVNLNAPAQLKPVIPQFEKYYRLINLHDITHDMLSLEDSELELERQKKEKYTSSGHLELYFDSNGTNGVVIAGILLHFPTPHVQ